MALLPNIKNYAIQELVAEGKHTMIFRALSKIDQRSVIIKLLKAESVGPKNVEQLTHEFNMMSKVHSPYVVRALELVPVQNSLILVMEDFNGKPISQLLEEEEWDLLLALETAINIASAVGDIHHQNIIHKDLKPQNILFNLATKETKIIDFGIATQLSREMQTALNPEQMKGSIAYMSPEQTGRMNRSIDYRSDLYSLGVTLYQLFTKRLPFEANSALELIHMHIAQQPQAPNEVNDAIPQVLSEIILKCMSKEAEHRYHSAYGLRYDLEKCRESLFATSESAYFEIGSRDVFDHFSYPEKLYGRQKELNFINQCFNEVWSGNTLLLTLSGYSGVGKSSLVFEAQKKLPVANGRFAYAKFDQFKHAIPYHGIIQAFQVIINQILSEPDEVLQEWKERITAALGDSGKVLVDVLPEIELIIGEQSDVEKLTPQETANRFNFVMVNFLKALLRPDSPLVFFIDDLHWADEPSLKLLELFYSNPTVHHFLMVATYRDNEVTPFHPLSITLREISTYGSKVINLPIAPLSLESIQEMIQDTFFGPPKQAEELAKLLYRKTQGNPFFTLQLLKVLYEKELFVFDKVRSYWKAQLEAIATSQVSDNVADLVVAKLKSIPEEVLEVLKIGATVENRFDLELLKQVSTFSSEKILHCLNIAQQEDLILQESQQTGFIETKQRGGAAQPKVQYYRFLHDRIQQATYSLLTEDAKAKLHYDIGTAILRHSSSGKLQDKIIDIVNHLNATKPSFLSWEEKANLIQLNLTAGLKAKDSAAYLSAIQYFSKGVELLSQESWEKDYDLAMALHENLAICLMITGGINKAQELFDLCLDKSQSIIQKAEIYSHLIFLYSQVQQYGRSLDIAVKALKMFGYDYDLHPSKLSLIKQILKHKSKMFFRKIEDLEKMPPATDQNAYAILTIVAALLYPAMVIGNRPLFVQNSLTIVDLTLTYGISKHCASGLVCLAMVLGSEMFKDYESCYRYGTTARNLALRYPKTAESAGSLYLYYSFIHRWRLPLKASILPLKQNFRKVLESGASTIAAANAVYINLMSLITGDRLDNVLNGILEALMEIKKFSSKSEEMSLMVHREVCLALKGVSPDPTDPRPSELTDDVLDSSRSNNQYVLFTMRYDVWHMVLLYLFGKPQEAVTVAQKCVDRIHSFPNWIETHVFYFFFSLALAALLQRPEDNPQLWKQLNSNFKILKRWGGASPLNYLHYMLLIQAEIARITGSKGAVEIYEQAMEAAKKNGCTQDIAIAYELFGNYYKSLNFKEMSSVLYHKALQYYSEWGAEAKCLHFKNVHAEDLTLETLALSPLSAAEMIFPVTDESLATRTLSRSESVVKQSDASDFDTNTLIDASQALSKEIVLDKLMETLMHVVIVNAGADKAFLILHEDKQWKIYSQTHLNQKYSPLISPIPIEEMGEELCLAALKFVIRTHRELLLNNVMDEGNFRYDPYVLQHKPKSMLCLPFIQKGTLTGLLYLENNVSKNAFTPKRLRLLSLLSSQMAISIENAQFYAKLESKVRERTKELQARNQELHQALRMIKTVQEQMIQQEKLASLGLLTSGIAHELKNPLNFVINFSLITKDQIQEFVDMLRKEGKVDPDLLNSFEKDVFDTLKRIDIHGRRADDIIQGMLAHAHQGSKNAEPIEINNLVEQALNLTYQSYRKKDQKFKVTLEKHLDPKLKTIVGFPGDLIRVFINIFDNAFYAQLDLFKAKPHHQPMVMIKTELQGEQAVVTIRDNGQGIPQPILDKIFQPFFTTKPTGSGTGLGLSIAYDIITKQHGGQIEVKSEEDKYTEFVIHLPVNLNATLPSK